MILFDPAMLLLAFGAALGTSSPSHRQPEAARQACRPAGSPIGPSAVSAAALERMLRSGDGCWKVVNFWAGWCAPCRAEVPRLVALQGDARFRRLRVITVNMDLPEFRSVAHILLVRAGASKTINVELAPPDFDDVRQIAGGPWNMSLPLTLIIGPDGRQLVRHDGEIRIGGLVDYLVRRGVRSAQTEPTSPVDRTPR